MFFTQNSEIVYSALENFDKFYKEPENKKNYQNYLNYSVDRVKFIK